MLKIYSVPEAKSSILQRSMGPHTPVSESVRAGIERIFGEALSPETAVARLLADVRDHGNQAIVDWTERIDGIHLESFLVAES